LSHDAYLRFLEDLFTYEARLGNPTRRDEAFAGNDLLNEFDFNRKPLTPTSIANLSCQAP
jgi:hypothetical protein